MALNDSIAKEVANLRGSLQRETIIALKAGLQKSQAAFDRAIANIEAKDTSLMKKLDDRHKKIESQAKKLFEFDDLKRWVFWGGCVCNVVVLALLVSLLW